jgi:hypothetical protein
MCEFCSKLYKAIEKHEPFECAVAAAMWCHTCKKYGHSTLKCPNPSPTRSPQFMEQLLPHATRKHYNIPSTQMTPLTTEYTPRPPLYEPVIEIPEDKDGNIYTGNIRATLASYSLPSSSVKENKRLIEAFGTLIGKRVVLTKAEKLERYALETLNAKLGKRTVYTQASPFEPEPEPEEKKKRTFVLKKKNSAS